MAGGDGGAGPGARYGRRWDVALSFAGAQRDYVGQVARALEAQGVRCFYDADEQIGLWGKYLAEELPAIYSEQAATVVVFVSAEYAARDWTRLERRAALNRAVQERREYVLPARFDDTPLPGLLSDMVAVNLRGQPPGQFADMIAAKLAALGITGPAGGQEKAQSVRPPGVVRVAEADLRRLGVHAAISVPGISDEIPPQYVLRDTDNDEHGVRAKVTAAAERGGFVLLTGGSSVGKTRCAAEAVKELLPDWWLIHPAGPAEVAALAAAPPARTVVWLDELQRYLDGEHGLTGGTIRALLGPPGLVVVIATLWPDRYAAYTAVPASGQADPHARKREVLDLAAVIRISFRLSAAEQDRARVAATRDPRLAAAVTAEGYGLTQTLAAAPQLVARWEDAQETSPYAWAVLTAALDAGRLGTRAPLTAGFLRAAAPGYCTPAQQAKAPASWFEQALAYATEELHGAAAALAPAGTGMGQVAGYTVADYLLQHATRQRRTARVPASTWDAVVDHVRDSADAARLADSAAGRLLYRYAIPFYRHAADAGDVEAAMRLARLLEQRGDLGGATQALHAAADPGDWYTAGRLADLLVEHGDLDGLRGRADAGDGYAAMRLAGLLMERGDLDGLRARADAGDRAAAKRLARLLRERGDLDELRARADVGDEYAAGQLAGLLAGRGDLDELRVWASVGEVDAAMRLAWLLAERGDLDELRARVERGDVEAVLRLAEALEQRGDLEDLDEAAHVLRFAADIVGDVEAAVRLARLLKQRGDLDGLRARADAGDGHAAVRLAEALEQRGDLDEATQVLQAAADTGGWYAAMRLAETLAERGDLDGLRARADAGDMGAATWLARLLEQRGDLDGLQARASVGDGHAAMRLAEALEQRGDLDEATQALQATARTGNREASLLLARLLEQRGDLDGLRARADADDGYAAMRLARLLAKTEDLDGLRGRADAGDRAAAGQLAEALAERGDLDELRARADAGDEYAAMRLAGLLAGRGDLDELRARASVGDGYAAGRLAELAQQGRGEETDRLRRYGLNPDGSIAGR